MARRKTKSVKKKATFSHKDFLMYILVFALVGAFALWVSFAAPHKAVGTVSLVMVKDNNSDGLPNWGDTITFNVTDSAAFPSVQLACYQNGNLEYTATRGFYPTYFFSRDYILENQFWTGGAADCTATLYHTTKANKNITDAIISFHVDA